MGLLKELLDGHAAYGGTPLSSFEKHIFERGFSDADTRSTRRRILDPIGASHAPANP